MTNESFYFKTSDNLKLFGQTWTQDIPSKAKSNILILHGLGSHSDNFPTIIDHFYNKNYNIFSYDQRGHGRSEGKKGYTPDYEYLLEDLQLFIEKIKQDLNNQPLILYACSMGGNIGLNFLMRKESIIDLAVVSSPWIKVENNNPKILYWFGKLMYKIYPKLSVRGTVERNINEENKSSLKDPLAHDKLTPQLFFDCEKAGLWLYENPTKLTIPILLMHGSNDLLTSFSASQEFALKSEYVEFKSWEGRGHILHKENKYEKVLKFAENWISEKLK